MDRETIVEQIKNASSSYVKVAVTDMDGILRGKMMHKEKLLSVLDTGFGFCDVVFGWDMMDVVYPHSKVTGWHSGYPDAKARLDLTTLRVMSWDNDVPLLLADFDVPNSPHADVCPRSLLRRVNQDCREQGFEPVFAQEIEWFNYKAHEDSLTSLTKPLTQGMFGYSMLRLSENSSFFDELFECLETFRVPLEGLHTETGPGVMEAAIRYSDLMESADRATLFKSSVKQIAAKHGIKASFMAKPKDELPGCGGHIHQSLWRDGINAFFDRKDPNGMSETMQSYVAGQLHCLPDILPMFAPNVNSYKRYVEGSWAPTHVNWGIDNRTCALRVVGQEASSLRLESRIVGCDVNPYLAHAACLASGLYGVKNKMKLDMKPAKGSAYDHPKNTKLPSNLYDASVQMSTSVLAKQLFGENFVDHFTQTRIWEWQQFMNSVTDWEAKRYFEIV